MLLSNSFENGLATGTTLTPVNAGGGAGDPPDSLSLAGGATATVSTTSPVMGTRSAVFTTPVGGSTSRWTWTTSLGGTFSRLQFLVQVQPGNLTPSQMPFIRWMAGGSQAARLTVNSTGNVAFRNGASSSVATSAGTMAITDKWTIIGDVTFGTSGAGDIYIYYAGSTTPDEHLTFSSANLVSSAIDEVDFGVCATTVSASVKLDSILITDQGLPNLPITLGTAAAPLGGLSASATGSRTVNGTAAAPLGGVTASAAGTATTIVTGAAAAPLGGLTAAAAGQASAGSVVFGSASAPLGGVGAAAAGVIGGLVFGSGAAGVGGITASATGRAIVNGVASAPLGGVAAGASAIQLRFLFTPPQRKQVVMLAGALRYSFPVSSTVWKDENGVWRSQETPSSDQLNVATHLLSVSGRPEEVDVATAGELIAAGIGTVTQF